MSHNSAISVLTSEIYPSEADLLALVLDTVTSEHSRPSDEPGEVLRLGARLGRGGDLYQGTGRGVPDLPPAQGLSPASINLPNPVYRLHVELVVGLKRNKALPGSAA